MEKPDSEKLPHSKVGYEHPSQHRQACRSCEHFIHASPRPRCEGVKDPIRWEDWCERFEPEALGQMGVKRAAIRNRD
jgi:hypothetical protein